MGIPHRVVYDGPPAASIPPACFRSPPVTDSPLTSLLRQTIDDSHEELVRIRRHFHQNPELSFQEFETTRTLSRMLTEWGVEHRVLPIGVGIVAEIHGPKPGPMVAIRADIDALPIHELTETPYASTREGVMHACGHDAHMTCSLGAIQGLRAVQERLAGTVRVLFQPAEEVAPGGAEAMVKQGVLEGVQAIFALHVAPEVPVGKIGLRHGAFTASADTFFLKLIGQSGHGARPHQAVDPIFVGSQLLNELYHVVGRQFDPREAAVISVGRFRSGDAANVIPESAELAGTIRCTSLEMRPQVLRRVRKTIDHFCDLYNARYELELIKGPPPVVNDTTCNTIFEEVGTEVLGHDNIYWIAKPSMGSEDFAEFLQVVPGAMFRLGVGSQRCRHGLHSAFFDLEEDALAIGAKLLSEAAARMLERLSDGAIQA